MFLYTLNIGNSFKYSIISSKYFSREIHFGNLKECYNIIEIESILECFSCNAHGNTQFGRLQHVLDDWKPNNQFLYCIQVAS